MSSDKTDRHPFNGLFSRQPEQAGTRKVKTVWNSMQQWHQQDHMYISCTLLQTDNHVSTSSLTFYRLDALPDAQPRVRKHWGQAFLYELTDIMMESWHKGSNAPLCRSLAVDQEMMRPVGDSLQLSSTCGVPFSALILLAEWQKGRPAGRKLYHLLQQDLFPKISTQRQPSRNS